MFSREKSVRGREGGSGHDYVILLSGGGQGAGVLITVDYRWPAGEGVKIAKILITLYVNDPLAICTG